jgi:hypothetical protein
MIIMIEANSTHPAPTGARSLPLVPLYPVAAISPPSSCRSRRDEHVARPFRIYLKYRPPIGGRPPLPPGFT